MGKRQSLYLAVAAPAIAAVLVGARFALQGSVGLYTEAAKKFYVSDPDLGWRLSDDTYHWLGLERAAAVGAFAGFVVVCAFLIQWRERKRDVVMKKARLGLWALSPLPLVIPLLALISGTPPSGARATAPTITDDVKTVYAASLTTAPSGVYRVSDHGGTLIAAQLVAGGASFEGKWGSGFRGQWQGDPSNFATASSAEVFVDAKSLDTGIDLRNEHARGYLKVEEFGEIGFRLGSISGTAATDVANRIAFSGVGTVIVMGSEIATSVEGTVTELDEAGKARLSLGTAPALVVNASMLIKISETPIKASLFDKDEVAINVSLVLTYEGKS